MRKVLVAVFSACLLVLGVAIQVAHSKGIEVCTPDGQLCNPASVDNIQAAIDGASRGSVIKLSNGVYTEHNILIKKNITVQGEDPRNTIIEANALPCWGTQRVVTQTERVFEIAAGLVSLENLTIRNGCAVGLAEDAQGGGIWSAGDLQLKRVIVQENTARVPQSGIAATISITGYAQGGGIYSTGNVRIDSSSIISNVAVAEVTGAYGGGIYNNGKATVVNSTIGGNRAQDVGFNGQYFVGGGIFSGGSSLIAEYNSLVGNFATTAGGGVVADGPFNLINNLFHQNESIQGTKDCIDVPAQSGLEGQARYTAAPPCEMLRPPGVQLTTVTTDTVVPVYRPVTNLGAKSGSMNVADCTASTVRVDQLGNPRGLGGMCDLGAVDAAMSFLPTVWSAPAKPDLRVRSVKIEPSGPINAGTKVMITVVVENIGNLATQRAFYIDLFINPRETPPNRGGVTWLDLCRTEGCVGDEGMIWLAPPTITEDGGIYTFRTDLDNDPTVVRLSSKFDRYLPEGPVDIWVYVDSYSKDRLANGLIDELDEGNNQYRHPTLVVKPGRILPGAVSADGQPVERPSLPAIEP